MYIVGTHDDNTIEQLRDVQSRADRVAIMADGHLGYWMPIGGVAAFKNWVSPVGVGFDIGCGNCAIKTDMSFDDLGETEDTRHANLSRIANDIQKHISFGVGRSNLSKDAPTDHSLFDDERWEVLPQACDKKALKKLARDQLGTVGSGNHYVDVFRDEDDKIWVGVHFGSRGFGHKICTGFTCIASGARWSTKIITSDSNPGGLMYIKDWGGEAYFAMMELAGEYAYAGREWVTRFIVENILSANELEMVHNHHNFAWKEKHVDATGENMEDYIVIRKGATPAFPGQKGFVGGSMGDNSVILQGTDYARTILDDIFDDPYDGAVDTDFINQKNRRISEQQRQMMYSTVHGAGRVMGRAQAKGKKDKKTGEWKREPRVTQDMMDEWVKKAGIYLRGGGRDESPHVYRRLPDVLEAQGDTVEVLHTLTPIVVVMAGDDIRDPYKD